MSFAFPIHAELVISPYCLVNQINAIQTAFFYFDKIFEKIFCGVVADIVDIWDS